MSISYKELSHIFYSIQDKSNKLLTDRKIYLHHQAIFRISAFCDYISAMKAYNFSCQIKPDSIAFLCRHVLASVESLEYLMLFSFFNSKSVVFYKNLCFSSFGCSCTVVVSFSTVFLLVVTGIVLACSTGFELSTFLSCVAIEFSFVSS